MNFKETQSGVTFAVKVIPRAGRNQVAGVEGEALKVRQAAPPVEGAANAALLDFLAHLLGVRQAQVSLIGGHTSRHKVVLVQGCSITQIETAILGHRQREGNRV